MKSISYPTPPPKEIQPRRLRPGQTVFSFASALGREVELFDPSNFVFIRGFNETGARPPPLFVPPV
jgi:hypothetical protein